MVPKAPKSPGFPLHLFNATQTKAWVTMPIVRAEVASCVAARYPQTGAGILTDAGDLIAIVQPSGRFRDLKAPFTRFHYWQAANSPHAEQECACRNYIDPEYGTWGVRLAHEKKRGAEHHPFCQFKDTAMHTFGKAHDAAAPRYLQGLSPQQRPDEWLRQEREVKQS